MAWLMISRNNVNLHRYRYPSTIALYLFLMCNSSGVNTTWIQPGLWILITFFNAEPDPDSTPHQSDATLRSLSTDPPGLLAIKAPEF